MKAELVLDAKADLAEGPSWDMAIGRLIWVDITGKKVHFFDPATGTDHSIAVDELVGAAVPAKDGSVIVAMQNGFHRLDPATGKLTFIADPEAHIANTRFNDGKCDRNGRFWAGTMDVAGSIPNLGSLYCLHADGSVTTHVTQVSISNGITWSPDGKVMYYIDSPTKRVDAFDFDAERGVLSQRRTVVTIPEGGGVPDGMTTDEEGMLWVAQWGGYQVSRWNPANGELLATIPVPAPHVSSCAFGGANLDELYITTARSGTSDELLAQYPHTGGLFRVKPGVKGAPSYTFG